MKTNPDIELPPNDGPVVVASNVVAIPTPMTLLEQALQSGASVEVLTGLMALQERWEATQARKEFDNAIAAAKAELPTIFKNRMVDFTSQKGRTNYRYEDLAGLAKSVDPVLAKHGLSYRFRVSTEADKVSVACIISHRAGHSEEGKLLTAPLDLSGNKNQIQAVGSTVTYLQRYSLKAALGLAVSNDDDALAVSAGPSGVIDEKQFRELWALIENKGADTTAFCQYFKVERVQDLAARDYDRAIKALNKKKAKKS